MKYIKLIVALLFVLSAPYTFADCNLKVAISAGQYLEALEKVELRKYQNNSVCEVLSYEFWNCSKTQKKKLTSSFNVKEVLGNYCQPHLPPPRNAFSKEDFMKGANLYSWKDYNGYIWFALLPATNGTKSAKELTKNKVSSGYLQQEFKGLPSKTEIRWNNLISLKEKAHLKFSLPEDKVVKKIVTSAESEGLKIHVLR